jgi:hypothetical protein
MRKPVSSAPGDEAGEEACPALSTHPTNDGRKLVFDILGETILRQTKIDLNYDDRATIVGKREAKCLRF